MATKVDLTAPWQLYAISVGTGLLVGGGLGAGVAKRKPLLGALVGAAMGGAWGAGAVVLMERGLETAVERELAPPGDAGQFAHGQRVSMPPFAQYQRR